MSAHLEEERSEFKQKGQENDFRHFRYLFFLKETVHGLCDISSVDGVVIRVVAVIAFFY